MTFKESGGIKEQKKPLSFAELEQKEGVSSAELIATLKDYVESGSAILPSAVLGLIRSVKLTPADREIIKKIAQKGCEVQDARNEAKAAEEYQEVVDHMDDVIATPGK